MITALFRAAARIRALFSRPSLDRQLKEELAEHLVLLTEEYERRGLDPFSLSFLDCVCCGFGAIILLLTLVRMGEPSAIEHAREELQGRIARLERELYEIRGETQVLNRELVGRREQLSRDREGVARLQGDLE